MKAKKAEIAMRIYTVDASNAEQTDKEPKRNERKKN